MHGPRRIVWMILMEYGFIMVWYIQSAAEEESMEREIHNIGLLIKCMDNTIMRRALEDIPEEEERPPVMQGWIIKYLHDRQGEDVFQKDIERDFHIARSTVTSLVKQMEREGYIARVGVERDSRLKKIILLERGEILCDCISENNSILEDRMVQGISPEDLELFLKVARQILRNLGCRECKAAMTSSEEKPGRALERVRREREG